MTEPSVTVVIATNRGGPFLHEAVASVRAQSFHVGEIILVDDGSPEPGLADTAAQLGIRYRRQAAAGVSTARNAGAEMAAGEWIAFLDDDDVWHPERIEHQLDALVAKPGAVAAATGGWYMDAVGAATGEGWGAPQATSRQMIAYDRVPPRITTLLVRRDVFLRAGGFRADLALAEDNELIQRLLTHGEFASVDRRLVGYRRHPANVTRRGLAGREANRRVIRLLLAESAGQRDRRALLRRHRRAFRRYAADDNLGEFIAAVRNGEPRYSAAIAFWGIFHVPAQSVAAVVRRWAARGPRAERGTVANSTRH